MPRYLLIGALALLFLGPPVAATYLYLSPDVWRPQDTSNHGDLIYPPLAVKASELRTIDSDAPLRADELEGHWTLGYASDGDCLGQCQERLFHLRQVRIALGKDRDRVQRLLLTGPEGTSGVHVKDILRMYPELEAAIPPEAAALPVDGPETDTPIRPGDVFVVDPQGNLMMRYPEEIGPMEVLEDLRQLLRNSKMG